MGVLLSIKPEFVQKIIDGDKRYEFRRSIFKRKDIREIVIYSSSPTKKIVGFFILSRIIRDNPKRLWSKFQEEAGINKNDFFHYFHGKREGFALEIEELQLFNRPVDPNDFLDNFRPPQSFCYIDPSVIENMVSI